MKKQILLGKLVYDVADKWIISEESCLPILMELFSIR
jgi:hypothetical protein